MTSFNIQILDDFLPDDIFKNVLEYASQIEWGAKDLYYGSKDKHVWFSKNIQNEKEFKNILIKNIKEKTNLKIKNFELLAFTLAPKTQPYPHVDRHEDIDNQMILYVDGDAEINKGTGFYVPGKDGVELNTHVGFYKNRAVFFKSGIWHSPLVFASDNPKPRISIIAQF